MKLLVETVEGVGYLTEEVNGKKRLYIEGTFLQSEQKNRNGRIYPKGLLEREVARYTKEKIDRNCAWGELGHPDTPTINLDRACMRIVALKEDGNDWRGKAMILDTPHGKIVEALIDSGGTIGVSSRGVGSVKMVEGINMVQDDYHLSTGADIVADPSAPDAYVQGLREGKEWIWNNGIIQEVDVARQYKQLMKVKRADVEKVALSIFEDFINKL